MASTSASCIFYRFDYARINRRRGFSVICQKPTLDLSRRNPSKQVSGRNISDPSLIRSLCYYMESGCVDVALSAFEDMDRSDPYVWTTIIRGLANNEFFSDAIDFFYRMRFEAVKPDHYTYPFVIKACTALRSLVEGSKVHSMAIKFGLANDIFICNTLIVMYSKLEGVKTARNLFDEMPERDRVSWNSMISGYVSSRDGKNSLMCFRKMQALGLEPDIFTMISALGACALDKSLKNGKEIHFQVIIRGFTLKITVQTSLIDMYSKCGRMDYAEKLFCRMPQKNSVVWNALVHGYALNSQHDQAFACLIEMQSVGVNNQPDIVTMINILPSCAKSGALLYGKSVHGFSIRREFFPDVVLETALVHMYGKCDEMKLAEQVFYQMNVKTLVSWNAMIAAYVENDESAEALRLFLGLWNSASLRPDCVTIASIIPAYSKVGSLQEAEQIHGYIMKSELSSNTFITNSIIGMYGKCGDIDGAQKIFVHTLFRTIVSWNAIMMAHAIHGFGKVSIELFSEMKKSGVEPDLDSFASLLTSCSIAGLVDEGFEFFDLMKREYGMVPRLNHYSCIVDLLGRVGNLEAANNFIREIPIPSNGKIWGSLLRASRHQKDIGVAEFAAEQIISSGEGDNTGCYVSLRNLYAGLGRWDDVGRTNAVMQKLGFVETIGCSSLENSCNRRSANRFVDHDSSHVEKNEIYNVLDILSRRDVEENGVHPSNIFSPMRVLKRRESLPDFHSVRLAIVYGLISTTIGKTIIVRKNRRLCVDCHGTAKKISGITGREIVVGNPKIYHHFKNGVCSCGDYW